MKFVQEPTILLAICPNYDKPNNFFMIYLLVLYICEG